MSTPVADTKSAAEEQVPKAEEKQETSTASEDVQVKGEEEASKEEPSSSTAEPTAEEVDSSSDEATPEAASGEEAKPAEGEKSDDTKASNDNKNRRNGATRKRYKWLLEQGYSREEAAAKAKEPLNIQELEEYKSLSGAAKKRYNWLLKNGHSDKDALKLAREPMGPTKRNLSANSGSQTKVTKAPADPAGGMVMAVAVMDYPNTSFTKTQANDFKSAILKEVIAQKDSELKPHFESCTYVKGYLRVHCSDEDTRRWLQRVVSKLTVPEGMEKLKIIAEKNLLKGDIYTGFFPDSRKDENAAILEFVESQNESIDTSKWKILSRKEVPNKQAVELTFTMDQGSAKSIQALGYEVNYKFNKIKFRKQNKSGDVPAHANNNMRPVGNMGPPQARGLYNPQGQRMNLNVWDNNYGQNRGLNNFNRFDNSRNSFGSNSGGFGWSNGGNSFGLGAGGGGGSNSFGGGNNSFGGASNSFGGGSNNPFANAIAMAGNRNRFQSDSERPFNNLIESLYDQLKIIGNTTNSGGNNSGSNNNYNSSNFGSTRRSGDGNDNGANNSTNNNQWGRNAGNNSGASTSYPGRSSNYYGNRSFFTTTRTGFF